MDWTAAIEKHREALKGIVAALVAMAAGAGLVSHGCGDAPGRHPEVRAEGEPRRTLPRHLHRAVLRLLRPAESAARRLVIALARGLARPARPAPAQVQPAEAAQGLVAPGARRRRHRHRAQARRAGPGPSRPSRSLQSRSPPAFLPAARSVAAIARPPPVAARRRRAARLHGRRDGSALPSRPGGRPCPTIPLMRAVLAGGSPHSLARSTICRGRPGASRAGKRGATGRSALAAFTASRRCAAAGRRAGAWRVTIRMPRVGPTSATSTRSWRMPTRWPITRWPTGRSAPTRHDAFHLQGIRKEEQPGR